MDTTTYQDLTPGGVGLIDKVFSSEDEEWRRCCGARTPLPDDEDEGIRTYRPPQMHDYHWAYHKFKTAVHETDQPMMPAFRMWVASHNGVALSTLPEDIPIGMLNVPQLRFFEAYKSALRLIEQWNLPD